MRFQMKDEGEPARARVCGEGEGVGRGMKRVFGYYFISINYFANTPSYPLLLILYAKGGRRPRDVISLFFHILLR